jgi:hypothetical protein
MPLAHLPRSFHIDVRARSRLWRFPVVVALITLTMLLAACEEEEHRAVSPGVAKSLATAVAQNGPIDGTTPDAGHALDSDLEMVLLPDSDRIYFPFGGDLWEMPAVGDPDTVIESREIAGYSASATGNVLAALFSERRGDDDVLQVEMLRPDGTPMLTMDQLGLSDDLQGTMIIESLALSPTGDRLAVTDRDGGMHVAGLDGLHQLIDPSLNRQPGQMRWSSDGSLVAFLDPWLPGEASALYVIVVETGQRQVLVQRGDDGAGVVRSSWIPGTSLIVYTKESRSTIRHGGDVFLVDAMTGEQRLLLSAGQFAPVAGVVDFTVAPTGDKMVFTVFTPGDPVPGFDGLYLLDFRSGELDDIAVERGHIVTDVWWLGDSVLYRAIDEARTSLPGAYTGQEQFWLVEYSPATGRQDVRFAFADD